MLLKTRCKHLVVDSSAFLLNAPIQTVGQNIYTIPEVIEEIKDEATRSRLAILPYKLNVQSPEPALVKEVVAAAKLTGDYSVLSTTDIKLIALALTFKKKILTPKVDDSKTENVITSNNSTKITPKVQSMIHHSKDDLMEVANSSETLLQNIKNGECQINYINLIPLNKKSRSINPSICSNSTHKISGDNLEKLPPGFYNPKKETLKCSHSLKNVPSLQTNLSGDSEDIKHNLNHLIKGFKANNLIDNNVAQTLTMENLNCSNNIVQEDGNDNEDINSLVEEDDFDEEDDSSWINPANLSQYLDQPFEHDYTSPEDVILTDDTNNEIEASGKADDICTLQTAEEYCACLTDDYAMQNVCFKLGLPVRSSRNGGIITELKNYVLFCKACYKTTTQQGKYFCSHCGNRSLTRVAYSIDKEGTKTLHVNAQRMSCTKGTKFSLPLPRGGKHPKYAVMVKEDQKLAQNRPTKPRAQKQRDRVMNKLLSSATLAVDSSYSPFAHKDIHSRAFRKCGLIATSTSASKVTEQSRQELKKLTSRPNPYRTFKRKK